MQNFSELSARAAALENAHEYAEANKLWTDAAKIGNAAQNEYAQNRADYCASAILREWA